MSKLSHTVISNACLPFLFIFCGWIGLAGSHRENLDDLGSVSLPASLRFHFAHASIRERLIKGDFPFSDQLHYVFTGTVFNDFEGTYHSTRQRAVISLYASAESMHTTSAYLYNLNALSDLSRMAPQLNPSTFKVLAPSGTVEVEGATICYLEGHAFTSDQKTVSLVVATDLHKKTARIVSRPGVLRRSPQDRSANFIFRPNRPSHALRLLSFCRGLYTEPTGLQRPSKEK